MTQDQALLFALFGLVFVFLIWGRWRYDLVAFTALVTALLLGLVPADEAFSGFGHPATIIVALVLVVSRGLANSGVVDLITRRLGAAIGSLPRHIALMASLGALLSAFMNNVAALALLMPVDLQAALKAGRSARRTLMPLSFATILGGLVTLIGTPPNIIVAAFRQSALGEPYAMFDFAPVGLACAAAGILFVALGGWRLIPADAGRSSADTMLPAESYVAELVVPEGSATVGKTVAELDGPAEEASVDILGVVRTGHRLPGLARGTKIRAGDTIVLQAPPEAIDSLRGALRLEFAGERDGDGQGQGGLALVEAVVPRDSRIEGRSAASLRLGRRYGVSLLGLSRQGQRLRERIRRTPIQAGDLLLLLGPAERMSDVMAWLGALPLAERGLTLTHHHRSGAAIGIFAAAIAAAAFGLIGLPVALALVVIAFVLIDVVPLRELYTTIEWPVIVLLGSMIPLGAALEASGGTTLIAGGLAGLAGGWPAAVVLAVLMVVVMTLSDVLNNTATAVIGAPVAVDLANRLGASPDPFLMAVAVAASCAFLTPIGHKNNTLIMGPGGYAFSDYWRMGLPLELIVIAVAIPVILVVWPL